MTWKLYRHDDAGAPVLDTSKGSMINLLEKCLVTGYGTTEQPTDPPDIPWNVSKSADGLHAVFWTDDANGSGHYFYIRDDGENDGDAGDDQVKAHGRECYLQGALTFTGFTNGKPDLADIFPDPTNRIRGTTWPKNQQSSKTSEWWLCADNRTVYLHWLCSDNEFSFTGTFGGIASTSRLTGFGDVTDMIDGADISFVDGNSTNYNNNNLGTLSLMQNGENVRLSTSASGAPGSTTLNFEPYAQDNNEHGYVNPQSLGDLSGPLWSRRRHCGYGDQQTVANLLRWRGIVELSLALDDQNDRNDFFFENLLGIPDGDPKFGEFTFAGMTLLALPTSFRISDSNILFIDIEDEQ